MILTVNGKPRDVHEDASLSDLLPRQAASSPRGIAIARNGAVVPRSGWDREQLKPGDRIEILNAVGGG